MTSQFGRPDFLDDEPIPRSLPPDVRWGFTRSGLYMVRHHMHWMAVTKGMARSFLARRWPDLVWNDMVKLLREAGVWIEDSTHFSNRDVAPHVKEFHILHDGTTRIVELPAEEIANAPSPDL